MNLVLLPLEGVSQTLFWQYREAMPRLWSLSTRAAMFRRFYSASTSALQSFADVAAGDSSSLDHNISYPAGEGCLAPGRKNLFSDLAGRGYMSLGLLRASPAPTYARANYYGAWPAECPPFQTHGGYDSFFSAAESFLELAKKENRPFVLYAADRAALIADASPEKAGAELYHEKFEKGFSLLDQTAGRILDKLIALDFIKDTVVVAFGPYGMDPWKHGVAAGRTTALEPYADLCWTPLIIYLNDNDICTADQLVSSIDLRPTLMHMLFPAEQQPPPAGPLTGVDILSFRRQTAFSQNLFALEREGFGAAQGLSKSYAATDGDQRLIVTSDSAASGGMELYYDPRDPGNTRNFLDFFDLNPQGNMTAFGRKDIIHPHFTMSFKPNLVMSVVNSYNTMRQQLYGFIRTKEAAALALSGGVGKENVFAEEAFTRKRKRK